MGRREESCGGRWPGATKVRGDAAKAALPLPFSWPWMCALPIPTLAPPGGTFGREVRMLCSLPRVRNFRVLRCVALGRGAPDQGNPRATRRAGGGICEN